MRVSLMVGCLVMLMTTACAGQQEMEGATVDNGLEFEEIARGTSSGVRGESMMAIRDQEALALAWSDIRQSGDMPTVDFEQAMVIAVFMGERRTGGHQVRVQEVSRDGEGLRVRVHMTAPGGNCMTTQAFTQPYQFVRLPRVDGPVEFEVEQVTEDC